MESSKLNSKDRNDAKKLINDHFDSQIEKLKDSESTVDDIKSAIEKKYEKDIKLIRDTYEKLKKLQKALSKKAKRSIDVHGDYISLSYEDRNQIKYGLNKETKESNRKVGEQKRRALSKMQVIETRKQLADLFKLIGLK